jgi:hypothetical protein
MHCILLSQGVSNNTIFSDCIFDKAEEFQPEPNVRDVTVGSIHEQKIKCMSFGSSTSIEGCNESMHQGTVATMILAQGHRTRK